MASTSLSLPPPSKRSRNWQELPAELTSSTLLHVSAFDMLLSARKVCKSWRSICSDPAMWRVIDLSYSGSPDDIGFYVGKIARKAVDLSSGQLIDFRIDYFGNNDVLHYISNRSSHLRRLYLSSCDDITNEGLSEMVKKLPLLEELHLYDVPICNRAIEAVGLCCPKLQTFKLSKSIHKYCRKPNIACDVGAVAIAENMPGLRHLQLQGNKIAIDGLLSILKNCLHLESLDLRMCFLVAELGTDFIKRLSPQMKDLKLPHDYTEYDEFDDQIYTCDTCNYSRPQYFAGLSDDDIDSDEFPGVSDRESEASF